ncbi:MAG: hypothetical protein JW843_10095 [Candidatus Aminicenantes bacterium]|nr:hypothetical protein [Candidatus Aminicenantes bacterium]
MNISIQKTLIGLKPGGVQTHRNMAIAPVSLGTNGKKGGNSGLDYLTMKEALDGGFLAVTEVSEGGSVPNLKAANKGDIAVLLLDGEEVAGAKQNRILNTTILIAGMSEVVIPVSCTEHGRWSYASQAFFDSGIMMEANARRMKHRSVNVSYAGRMGPRADQSEVWANVAELSARAQVSSETGSMRDIFERRKEDLDDYLKAFTCEEGRQGLVVFVDGRVVGFDYLSSAKAFAGIFPKLVKSYAMEAMLMDQEARRRAAHKSKGKVSGGESNKDGGEPGRPMTQAAAQKAVDEFFAQAAGCDEKSYDSVGLGKDFRYTGPQMVGSTLAVDDAVIHMAFFRLTEAEKAGNMAGPSRRRMFII